MTCDCITTYSHEVSTASDWEIMDGLSAPQSPNSVYHHIIPLQYSFVLKLHSKHNLNHGAIHKF